MVKKLKIITIILSVALVSLVIMLIYGVSCLGTPLKTVRVKVDGESVSELNVNVENLLPASSREYAIELDGKDVENFNISLRFKGDEENILSSRVGVTIKTQEKEVRSGLLHLINGEKVRLGRGVKRITIIYSLPKEVGNEVQGAEMDVKIEIEAKKLP